MVKTVLSYNVLRYVNIALVVRKVTQKSNQNIKIDNSILFEGRSNPNNLIGFIKQHYP